MVALFWICWRKWREFLKTCSLPSASEYSTQKHTQYLPVYILTALGKHITKLFFFTQVLRGLCYIHDERRIIHRDLKPSNLLINHRGEVKITDFGVSKILSSTSSLANTFVGTHLYMSVSRPLNTSPNMHETNVQEIIR